ncbi:MAG: hypothetical protein HGB03_00355 [Candidatus Yonathbacteria bacterium]|nr:hypothetical protein [Candidatus Yonathbacteria bacterium]NTW47718.1 hypothetical protein [Candidatus Yonathbacteria bacterium]
MQRLITTIILALVVAVFPHLGFPGYIKTAAITLFSLAIALIAYMGYREAKHETPLPMVSLPHMRMPSLKKKKTPAFFSGETSPRSSDEDTVSREETH